MKPHAVKDEIDRIKRSLEELRRKYGSFRRLYRYVEYDEPLGLNVDPVKAWDDMWRWKNLQAELEELRRQKSSTA